MDNNKGTFISFEGIDGCGKTTQAKLLLAALKNKGHAALLTREPGGTYISEQIRSIILNPQNQGLDDQSELLLYLAARAQHVAEIILPALEQEKIVLCDRFFDATFAYQGGGRGISLAEINVLNWFACRKLKPDLTFLLDMPSGLSLERLKKAGKIADRMEGSGTGFLDKVRNTYLDLAGREQDRFVVIDGTRDIREISLEINECWNSRFPDYPV
jgi:dTMP kinase